MTAHARWMYASALARTESRGMARRLDFPGQDPAQRHRIITGGLDEVWTRPEPVAALPVAAPPGAQLAVGPPLNPPGSKETSLPITS
ncbi:hypothetical protein [Streptomyces platensis]